MLFGEWVLMIVLTILGILSHFLKKKIKGETLSDIIQYFRTHFRSTLMVVVGALAGFAVTWQMDSLNYFSAFSVGYLADSFFNRVDEVGFIKFKK